MQISDLTLKLEVYQKTLEKKRQPTAPKFLDATSYTSLTSQSLSTSSSTTTPTASTTTNPLLSHHLNSNAHLNSLSSSSSMSSIANSNDPQDVFIDSSQQHRKNSTSINLLEIKPNSHNSEIGKTISSHPVVNQHESSPPPTISSHEASSTSSSSSASPSNQRSSNDDTPSSNINSKEIKIIRINGTKNENATNSSNGSNSLLMDAPSRHISNA